MTSIPEILDLFHLQITLNMLFVKREDQKKITRKPPRMTRVTLQAGLLASIITRATLFLLIFASLQSIGESEGFCFDGSKEGKSPFTNDVYCT